MASFLQSAGDALRNRRRGRPQKAGVASASRVIGVAAVGATILRRRATVQPATVPDRRAGGELGVGRNAQATRVASFRVTIE